LGSAFSTLSLCAWCTFSTSCSSETSTLIFLASRPVTNDLLANEGLPPAVNESFLCSSAGRCEFTRLPSQEFGAQLKYFDIKAAGLASAS